MKGRESKGPPSADLLVCFPSRVHLTLMPKPICSPARTSESNKRLHHHPHHRRSRSAFRGGGVGKASPLLWSKNKQMGSETSEPTSPKVTCAGQIKVRHKAATACKNWQSVMEEIERIHNNRKEKKRSNWADAFGFKKDVMQFLTCLRNIKFDLGCFGAFPQQVIVTDDEDEEEEEEEDDDDEFLQANPVEQTDRTIFSKWFNVLQEDQTEKQNFTDNSVSAPSVPPPNALLLMRCRSAPAKSWLEEKQEEEEEEAKKQENEEEEEEEQKLVVEVKKGKNLKALFEEERTSSKKENLVVMRYDADFYKISSDVAKETWVVDGMRDLLSRSRSWKR